MDEALFAGVDVGGTNVKYGIVSSDGKILAQDQFPTEQARGPKFALDTAAAKLREKLEQKGCPFDRLVACGLGTPGTMDIPAGMILEPPNLPGWRQFNVRDRLAEQLGIPVTYTNDANAAAYGEYWAGGGADFSSMVLITLGTGVGGGVIIDDFWIDGHNSHGAEIGHIVVDTSPDARICGCGRPGHLEAYASATSVAARAREQVAKRTDSALYGNENITALDVANAAEAGDVFANELVAETADFLVRGISLVVHVVDPQAIVLGGAMNFGGNDSVVGSKFLRSIQRRVTETVFPVVAENLKITFAELGSAAGWVGAAGLARIESGKQIAVNQ